jgi:hypothetical protein
VCVCVSHAALFHFFFSFLHRGRSPQTTVLLASAFMLLECTTLLLRCVGYVLCWMWLQPGDSKQSASSSFAFLVNCVCMSITTSIRSYSLFCLHYLIIIILLLLLSHISLLFNVLRTGMTIRGMMISEEEARYANIWISVEYRCHYKAKREIEIERAVVWQRQTMMDVPIKVACAQVKIVL